jgi:hypothetical protein
MKVLIDCERSQVACKAFRELNHDAYSCDQEPSYGDLPQYHIHDDAIKVLYSQKWDLVIAHPPCDRLANCGVRWLTEKEYWPELDDSIMFFNQFIIYGEMGNKIAIENPIQHKYARAEIRKYDQIIQPYHFGHLEQKATCLWLYGVPALVHTNNVFDEMMKLPYAERAKVHYCSPGKNRSTIRSKTYLGIAEAMASQWGNIQ